MPNYSFKVNKNSISKKVLKAGIEKGLPIAEKRALAVFEDAKKWLLKEFNEHSVTQEIEAGPRALNFSNTLGGYGNLFSFIGFERGDKPIERLRNLLINNTSFRYTVFRNNKWYFRVSLPSRKEIEENTKMPWEGGNSWAYGIERGISGLSYYLYKLKTTMSNPPSRSGKGIQLPHELNEDLSFSRTRYLNSMFEHFRNRINQV